MCDKATYDIIPGDKRNSLEVIKMINTRDAEMGGGREREKKK